MFSLVRILWWGGGDIPIERDRMLTDVNEILINKKQYIARSIKHPNVWIKCLYPKK